VFDVFIIQKIQEDEAKRRREEMERPRLDVPFPDRPSDDSTEPQGSAEERGILIIEPDED